MWEKVGKAGECCEEAGKTLLIREENAVLYRLFPAPGVLVPTFPTSTSRFGVAKRPRRLASDELPRKPAKKPVRPDGATEPRAASFTIPAFMSFMGSILWFSRVFSLVLLLRTAKL